MTKTLLLLNLLLIIFGVKSHAQQLRGKVSDRTNGVPLAFVNIVFDHSERGVTTDIDGRFVIKSIKGIEHLHFSYVGYYDTTIALKKVKTSYLKIELRPKSYSLSEVFIFPGENPAHRIIKECLSMRKENDPERLTSFSYKAYHKMVFTAKTTAEHQADSVVKGSNQLCIGISQSGPTEVRSSSSSTDSDSVPMVENIFSTQHLFMMESVTERFYKYPDKNKEIVLGTKVSGLKDPYFAAIATEFQSFSFYKTNIQILDKNYINPISTGSWRKYFFLIEDTLYEGEDSVFVISYRPMKGKKFDGLKGVLYINSRKYAIQNVIAEPADSSNDMAVRIQQKYELTDSAYWFPVQLNTSIEFRQVFLNNSPLVAIGKSYLRDIKIKPSVKDIRFNNVVLEMDRNSAKRDSSFWQANRVMPLDSLELKTYRVIDSIGKEEHFDRTLFVLRTLGKGAIPMGVMDLQLDKIINYNQFEGIRLGIGLKTNERFSKHLQLETYAAWSGKNFMWKYGGAMDVLLYRKSQFHLKLDYKFDVAESGAQASFEEHTLNNRSLYRDFLISRMYYINRIKAEMRFRAIPNFSWKFGFIHNDTKEGPTTDSREHPRTISGPGSVFDEYFAEVRFAYKEKIVRNPLYEFSLGTNYPVLNFRYTYGDFHNKGTSNAFGNFQRFDLQISESFFIPYLGKTSISLRGGQITGDKDLPWYKLYNGRGSYAAFYLETPNSFGTMRMNEFLSDRYFSVFFRHDFGSLLFGDKPFVPQPELITNFTIGSMGNNYPTIHYNTLEKGYFESGLMLNAILKSGVSGIGFGVFYRYGAYELPNVWNNFAWKMSLNFTL